MLVSTYLALLVKYFSCFSLFLHWTS